MNACTGNCDQGRDCDCGMDCTDEPLTRGERALLLAIYSASAILVCGFVGFLAGLALGVTRG